MISSGILYIYTHADNMVLISISKANLQEARNITRWAGHELSINEGGTIHDFPKKDKQ
jgi:hypothetical protein